MFPGMKLRHLLPKIRPQDLVIYIQGKRVLLDRQAKSPKARNEQNTDEEMTPFRRDTSLPSRFLHKALLSRVYWFPMAAETSHHKNRDLKQRCIIWQFQRPEVNPGLTGLNSGVSRAVFLPKAPGNSLSSCLFQLLEPAQIDLGLLNCKMETCSRDETIARWLAHSRCSLNASYSGRRFHC